MGYFTDYFSGYFDSGAAPEPPAVPVDGNLQKLVRSRTLKRIPRRYVRRLLRTPDGPLEVLVPEFDDAEVLAMLIAAAQ